MKKRILSVLFCLCMVMALLPTTALAGTYADDNYTFCVRVAGHEFSTGESSVSYWTCSDNTLTTTSADTWNVRYDPTGTTPTVTLKDFTFTGTQNAIRSQGDLNLVLEGTTNTISNTDDPGSEDRGVAVFELNGIMVKGDLTITGTSGATLTVNSAKGNAIEANDFAAENATRYNETLTIKNASITATGDGLGIGSTENLIIENSTIISSGNQYHGLQGGFYDTGHDFGNNGQIKITNSTITASSTTGTALEPAPVVTGDYQWKTSGTVSDVDGWTSSASSTPTYNTAISLLLKPGTPGSATRTVIVTPGANMTKVSGDAIQTPGSAMDDVVYTANDGYYFPDDYSVAEQSGVSVTKIDSTKIKVSGTPTGDVDLTLTAVTAKTPESTPDAGFIAESENGGKLTGVDNTMKYSVDGGSTWIDITGNNMAITNVTTANGVQVKQPASDANTKLDSDVKSISVTQAEKPTGVTGVACTNSSNIDGKLKNVTTDMEYKLSTAENWTPGTGSDITGLTNGTYYVRVKAKDAVLASDYQEVTVAEYTPPTVATPVLTEAGTFTGSKNITITCATDEASIYYTTDGTNPTSSSTLYSVPFDISTTTTVKAIAVKDGMTNSAVASATYTKSTTYTVTFNANGGSCGTSTLTTGADGKLTSLPTPTRSSYTFNGWYTLASGGTKITTNTVFATNTTVYAQWTYSGGSSSSSGGSSTPPTYKVESEVTENTDGSVSFSTGSAKKDDIVTITVTPDRYYKVDGVVVKDKNSNEIAVTANEDGTFTFQMPASQVTVEPVFSWDNPFTDVAEDTYYAPAVEWALKNDVTNGTGDGTTFSPDDDCTRAQIVTFLWHAAGCPEPTGASSFTDVSADAYYAKAVAWAVEQGITDGTGGGKFSPDAICTRSQGVTFLYRAADFPEASGNIAFSDVAAGSYYADAVAWAARNGVTNGTGDGKFSPGSDCTRAQIMTFLYRWLVK